MPAGIGVAALLAVTRHGAYVSPDGLAYLGTARNLARGHGYEAPPGSPAVGNFPPLFTLVLAVVAKLGPDPLTVVRVLNPILFGATILAVGLALRRATGSLPLALAAQLLVLAGVDFLGYHTTALSEPLFIFLAFTALAAMAAWIAAPSVELLTGAALLAGAASLTRYVGVAVIAAGAMGLVIAGKGRARRWRDPLAFTMIAAAPLVAWTAYLRAAEGHASNRTAVVHPPGWDYVAGGLGSAASWFAPDDFGRVAQGVAAAAIVLALVAVAWRCRKPAQAGDAPIRGAHLLALLFAFAYLAALAGDRWLFDITGRLDTRFLLPVHLAAIVLAAWALHATDLSRSHATRLAVSTVVGIQLVAGGLWVHDALTDRNVRPGGFTAPAWSRSRVIEEVRALPLTAPVYTNEVDALFLHTGRLAVPIPEKDAFLTGEPNMAYGAQLVAMADGLRGGGLLVYFTRAPARRAFLPTPGELGAALHLEEVDRDAVGVSYRLAPEGT